MIMIDIIEAKDSNGRIVSADCDVHVSFSWEYDNREIASLREKLVPFIREKLSVALAKGAANA